jgi:CRISPR/Cas system-associated endonuclease Cas1
MPMRRWKAKFEQGHSAGYDPAMVIMHEGNDGSSKFIFDFMESERTNVDRTALEFGKGHVFDPTDFVIRTDGCRFPLRSDPGFEN